jgi:hypothetical protein
MNQKLISKVCLALALILTVYNFIIVEQPVEPKAIGTVLLLLIVSNIFTSVKFSK